MVRLKYNGLFFLALLFSSQSSAEFELVGVHPSASVNWHGAGVPCFFENSLADGRPLWALKAYEGGIYSGYGDSGCNTGPIDLYRFDPLTRNFDYEFTQETETINHFTIVNGGLFANSSDPTGTIGGDAFAGRINGSWFTRRVEQMSGSNLERSIHLQEMGGYRGDLFLAGDFFNGNGQNPDLVGRQHARLWKSSDNGANWINFLSFPQFGGNINIPDLRPATFCFAATFNDKLYVQVAGFSCERRSEPVLNSTRVWDGQEWTIGPTFIPTTTGRTRKVQQFKDQLVMIHGSRIHSFNGTITTEKYPEFIRDYTISNEILYVLTWDLEVCSSENLDSFKCFDTAPSTSVSIEVLNNRVYVGTSNAKIFEAVIPTPPPEPEFSFIKYKNYLIPISSSEE